MEFIRRIGKPRSRRRVGLLAIGLLLVAGCSGISSCDGGEETAVRDAIEAGLHGGDVSTIEINGDSARATTFYEDHEFEIDLLKEGGKWTIENCVDESTHEFPSHECPLNYFDTSP
jgi:hypothetical protein